jgi:hypothetical protein
MHFKAWFIVFGTIWASLVIISGLIKADILTCVCGLLFAIQIQFMIKSQEIEELESRILELEKK